MADKPGWGDEDEVASPRAATTTLVAAGDAEIAAGLERKLEKDASSFVAGTETDPVAEVTAAVSAGLHLDPAAIEARRLDREAYMNSTAGGGAGELAKVTFEELGMSDQLIQGLKKKGWPVPSAIQGKALPVIMKKDPNGKLRSLVAQAKAGEGKTGAFALAILNAVDPEKNYPQAICVVPTLELGDANLQIIQELGCFTGRHVSDKGVLVLGSWRLTRTCVFRLYAD
jgi:hypothetical protein